MQFQNELKSKEKSMENWMRGKGCPNKDSNKVKDQGFKNKMLIGISSRNSRTKDSKLSNKNQITLRKLTYTDHLILRFL